MREARADAISSARVWRDALDTPHRQQDRVLQYLACGLPLHGHNWDFRTKPALQTSSIAFASKSSLLTSMHSCIIIPIHVGDRFCKLSYNRKLACVAGLDKLYCHYFDHHIWSWHQITCTLRRSFASKSLKQRSTPMNECMISATT